MGGGEEEEETRGMVGWLVGWLVGCLYSGSGGWMIGEEGHGDEKTGLVLYS